MRTFLYDLQVKERQVATGERGADGYRIYKTVPAHSARVELTIDEDAIADELCARAALNKSGAAKSMRGAIKAKVLK